jgi:N-acetylated-alpha-linked acidic dipeptidase
MDGAGGQQFGAAAVPSFDRLIRSVTKLVAWPGTSGTAYDNWAKNTGKKTPTPDRLGSGSDYTAFLDHFGVPAADIGSGTPSGDYHCSCDNFYMEDHFIDPGWKFHVATAQVMGLTVLRLADADVVPLHYTGYANEVRGYVNALAAQQKKRFGHVVVSLAAARKQAVRWAAAAKAFDAAVSSALDRGASRRTLDALTRRLERVERQLLVGRGLPGRPWFEHQIYAPGVNSGYGTQVLPAINDALFLRHRPAEAKRYAATLTASLRRVAATLR